MRPTGRFFAGPAHSAPKGGHPVHIHPISRWYTITAKALGASMWFFLFYRMKQDGPALLGLKHPWDH